MTLRQAVILPGGQNGPHAPLLMFAADAAEQRGARLTPVSWDDPDHLLTLSPDELGPWVLEIAEADHGMYVPGRLAASTAVLGEVVTAVEDFLDQVVWT